MPATDDPADKIAAHYERYAHAWDAERRAAAWNDRPWHDRFVAALPSAGRILDLGCGSGVPVAQYLIRHGFFVTGIDTSQTMISLCRERLPAHDWLVEDMRSLRLPLRFDGVLAWDSFFHLRRHDQRWMFDVFDRHAAPAAVLMFNSGPADGEAVGEHRGDASLAPKSTTGISFEVVAHAVEDWRTAAAAPSG